MLKANICITEQGLEFNLVDRWVTDVEENGEEINIRTADQSRSRGSRKRAIGKLLIFRMKRGVDLYIIHPE